ncbi:hypothetical protein F5880DRAFT_1494486 [Lentinula raphanica]|nr:hypothetical protein F5880DRAFT_1494486 [Lentinula raphanica]
MRNKLLTGATWSVLLYVCNNLVVFPPETSEMLQGMKSIKKRDISKNEMVDILIDWRLNGIHEVHSFVWPCFTPVHCPPARAPWSADLADLMIHSNGLAYRVLNNNDRCDYMQELTNSMNYTTAVHIGNIHQYLWETIENNATGTEKLAKRLKTKTKNSLLYVCADLNRFPRDHPNRAPLKDDLIALLVDWVSTMS